MFDPYGFPIPSSTQDTVEHEFNTYGFFPDDAYENSPQIGGGAYHGRLRRNVPISLNAPKISTKLASIRSQNVDSAALDDPQHDPNLLDHASPVGDPNRLTPVGVNPDFIDNDPTDWTQYYSGDLTTGGWNPTPSPNLQSQDAPLPAVRSYTPPPPVDDPTDLFSPQPTNDPINLFTPLQAASHHSAGGPDGQPPNDPADLFTPRPTNNPVDLFTPQPPASQPAASHHSAGGADGQPPNDPADLFTPQPTASRHDNDEADGDRTVRPGVLEMILDEMEFEPLKVPAKPRANAKVTGNAIHVDHRAGGIPDPVDIDIDDDDSWEDADESESQSLGSPTPSSRGRPRAAHRILIQEAFDKIDALFADTSAQVGKPLSAIIAQWNHTHRHGVKISPWNRFQAYFVANVEKERTRAGLTNGTGMFVLLIGNINLQVCSC